MHQLAEHGREHQLLALKAADVAEFVVAVAEEPLQVLAFENLHAGIEVDVEALAVVHVVHALGHIHLNAVEGVGQSLNGAQVHLEVVVHRHVQQLGQFPLHRLRASEGIEGVGLLDAEIRRFDVRIAGHLRELSGAVFHLDREHHIGAAAHRIGPEHQDPALLGDGIDQVGDTA